MSTKKTLYFAFALLLGLMLIIISISLLGLKTLNQQLEQTINNNLSKTQLTFQMRHNARERSIILHRMMLTDDPFERDEQELLIDKYGTAFGQARLALLNKSLTQEEKNILAKQSELTKIAVPSQRKVAELAFEEKMDEARKILLSETMPAQDRVFAELDQLILLQAQYANDKSEKATTVYWKSRLAMILLSVIVTLLSITIAYIFIRRITESERKLYKEKEKAEVTFRSIGDAIITINRNGLIEYINQKAENKIGLTRKEILGKSIQTIFKAYDENNQQDIYNTIESVLDGNKVEQISNNVNLTAFNGRHYNIRLMVAPIPGITGAIDGAVITFHDTTKEKKMIRQIEHQATHDALTGLLNRREFENKVKQALTLYEANTNHSFCIIDLDQFKIVNDLCGHQAGDELLRQLSQLLKSLMRRGDLISRIGGDEFAIFLSNIETDQALKLANKILQSISNFRFIWEDNTFKVGASIGLVDASPEISDYDFLYHAADNGCYIAKNNGRNQIHVMPISESILDKAKQETNWLSKINHALENNGFQLYRQEIVPISLRTEGSKHTEILLRMVEEDGKIISPMAFIPTAERYGLMIQIDYYVLQTTCQYLSQNPYGQHVFAINLSGQTLSSLTAMEKLIEHISKTDIDPGRIFFEVTETVTIANLENAISFINKVQKLGCHVALDDFGTGLSSFSYLKNLPLDYIKIDGSFIKDMATEKSSLMMVEAIHSVGKKLGLRTIAEYVENVEIYKLLKEIGVDYAQGFLFSVPRPLQKNDNSALKSK